MIWSTFGFTRFIIELLLSNFKFIAWAEVEILSKELHAESMSRKNHVSTFMKSTVGLIYQEVSSM